MKFHVLRIVKQFLLVFLFDRDWHFTRKIRQDLWIIISHFPTQFHFLKQKYLLPVLANKFVSRSISRSRCHRVATAATNDRNLSQKWIYFSGFISSSWRGRDHKSSRWRMTPFANFRPCSFRREIHSLNSHWTYRRRALICVSRERMALYKKLISCTKYIYHMFRYL